MGVLRASQDQRRSRARIRGMHGCSHIDDGVLTPTGHLWRPLSYSGSITGQTPRQGTPMVSRAVQLCETLPAHVLRDLCYRESGHRHRAAPWCWWQVPARRFRGGSGRWQDSQANVRSTAPSSNMRIYIYIITLLLFWALVGYVLLR